MTQYLINSIAQELTGIGKWIAPHNSEKGVNIFFRARKKFILQDTPKSAVLSIAAESYYLLYVNGIEIGRGPVRGTHRHNYYNSYEIVSLLHTGENVIAMLVQCMNEDNFITAPAQPALIAELDGFFGTGADWEVSIASDWRSDVESYNVQVGYCEWRDLTMEPLGWTKCEDTAVWKKAWEIPKTNKIHSKKLLARDIPALTEMTFCPVDIPVVAEVPAMSDPDSIKIYDLLLNEVYSKPTETRTNGLNYLLEATETPARIEAANDNSGVTVIFNFDTEVAGRFELDITAPSGTIIDIYHNELVVNDRLVVKHDQDPYHFTDRFILREGRQFIGNSVYQRGFKMVQIVCRNFASPITIHKVKAISCKYPFTRRASFNCDDLLLNKIWEACCETIECCTTDVFIDCPWRERSFWVNDLIIENKTSLEAFGVSEVHRRAFRLAFSDARENGIIPGVCPCPKDEDFFILVPTNLLIIIMLHDYLMYSGDKELIRELMPNIIAIIKTFESWEDVHGFIEPPKQYWNFFDWGFELNGITMNSKVTSLLTYLHIIALKTIIELAEIVEEKIDYQKYESKIKNISSNVEKYFFNNKSNRLANWVENGEYSEHSSQLAHAFALLSGEYSDTTKVHFEDALSDKNIIKPELYLHYFVFHAMRLCGKEIEAIERIRKYWGDIVKTGSSTIWEVGVHEHGKSGCFGDGSLCHAFATSPIDFFQTVILGVEPLSPGFKTFKVAPNALDLNFAEGRIPTPQGNIFIKWEREDNYLKVELRVPEGTVAKTIDGNNYLSGTHDFRLTTKEN